MPVHIQMFTQKQQLAYQYRDSCCFVAHGTQSVLYHSDVIALQQVIINLLVETANDVDIYHHSHSTSIWEQKILNIHFKCECCQPAQATA
jgi:hypothetical protein